MKTIIFLSGAALLAVAGAAAAQPGPDARPDRDADITRQQAIEHADRRSTGSTPMMTAASPARTRSAMRAERRERRADRLFERFDLDRNGSITREEVSQARARACASTAPSAASRRGMRGHRGGRRGGFGMRGHRLLGEQDAVTAEQFRERALARFDRADANHDGTLTAAERRDARRHRREQRRRGRLRRRQSRREGRARSGPPLFRFGTELFDAARFY